jgi:hypothetical protein
VPDAGVEGEEPLDDAGPESCGDAAAVAFEAELVLQGSDDGLDPLAEPVRSDLFGHAGYGYCPSHSRWYRGAKL